MQLWFAVPGVSFARLQAGVATSIAAFPEPMWIFQGQQEGQRNQRPYAMDLLEQFYFRIAALGDGPDPLVVFADPLAERLDLCQQRTQRVLQFRTQFLGALSDLP